MITWQMNRQRAAKLGNVVVIIIIFYCRSPTKTFLQIFFGRNKKRRGGGNEFFDIVYFHAKIKCEFAIWPEQLLVAVKESPSFGLEAKPGCGLFHTWMGDHSLSRSNIS